jgi:hypothetical protein
MKTDIHSWSYLAQFFLECEMFQTKFVEKIKAHILYSLTFYHKLCRLLDNVEKYCTAGQATDDNMAHAHFMMYSYDYTHTICKTYCFSTATVVTNAPQYYVTRAMQVLLY